MKETQNNQKTYKIRVYRDFEFPSFSLDPDNTIQDLYEKSLEEIEENSQEENYFNLEVTQVMPFTLKKELKQVPMQADFSFFIKEIALEDLQKMYGKIDYRTNPDIFDKRTRNPGDGVIEDSPYHLKDDVEKFYSDRVNYYLKALENKIYDTNTRRGENENRRGGIRVNL